MITLKSLAESYLTAEIDNVATELTIPAEHAGVFPNLLEGDGFVCAVVNRATRATELVRVTAVNGNKLTVVRGVEGFTALAFPVGASIDLRMTAGTWEEMAGECWMRPKDAAGELVLSTYATATSFTLTGDFTGFFTENRALRFDSGTDIGFVDYVSVDDGVTTVHVKEAVVPEALKLVEAGLDPNALAKRSLTNSELQGYKTPSPLLSGPDSAVERSVITLTIDDHSEELLNEYELDVRGFGSAEVTGSTVVWTMGTVEADENHEIRISRRRLGEFVSEPAIHSVLVTDCPFTIDGLEITSLADGAVGVKETPTVTAGTATASDPAFSHISTSWFVSPDGTKANAVVSSIDDTVNKNSWKIPKGMAVNTVYKLWREVRMSNGALVYDIASSMISFTTAEAFNVWRDYTATLDSQINSFLADLPYNLSMCKVSDTCFLTAFRLGSGLTLKCAALTRGSAEAVDFTAAAPFDVSPVDVNNNGLSALVPMGSNHVLSFFDPGGNLDAAVACRLLAKGATEADWAVSGSGIPLSSYGYVGSIKAAEGNELGVPCIYHEERAVNTYAIVVSSITRPTNTSNVLTKNELFVDILSSPSQTAIVDMSENEIIFAYSYYVNSSYNVKLYCLSRADSSSPWGAAQLITTYESLAQSAQYLELIRMSADRFVLSYYEGDLADDRVRGKVFNRVAGVWTAGNEFLTKEGNWAVRPVLASPNEETVVVVYGIDNAQAEVMVYDGTDWWTGDPVTVFDSNTGQKAMRVDNQNRLAIFFTKNLSPAAGNFKEMIAG
ncbi:hypothetical protein [Maridesulfovibrio sp.]|uniref:hypothetical protein n=1 Tax=Maridesulfovibrio sp. TaxID=2795000 RepID=UPI0029F5BEAA|nr:hypothetical protein [Maridesulfovibrio sp.]